LLKNMPALITGYDGKMKMLMGFRMGLWNLASSVYHSAVHNYLKLVILRDEKCYYEYAVHSDDSSILFTYESEEQLSRIMCKINMILMLCNIKMNMKKSNMNPYLSEFLSEYINVSRLFKTPFKFISANSCLYANENFYQQRLMCDQQTPFRLGLPIKYALVAQYLSNMFLDLSLGKARMRNVKNRKYMPVEFFGYMNSSPALTFISTRCVNLNKLMSLLQSNLSIDEKLEILLI